MMTCHPDSKTESKMYGSIVLLGWHMKKDLNSKKEFCTPISNCFQVQTPYQLISIKGYQSYQIEDLKAIHICFINHVAGGWDPASA